mmetsp:Transcript_45795/g.111005  ORF Transcript_45795/g.111005 Transcript_45795/m.111005 type:complete len:343 (+) Transcript_45795:129-1157(+)
MKRSHCCCLWMCFLASQGLAFVPQTLPRDFTTALLKSTVNQEAVETPLLEDRKGHINPELAQRIYKWEQEQRLNKNLPHLEHSTRDGLRWVLNLVNQLDRSSPNVSNSEDKHEDLVQEGVIALMQAMTNYEDQARPQQSFESFAKDTILRALEDYTWGVKTASTGGPQTSKPALSVENTVEIADPLETHYSSQEEWEIREPEQDFVDSSVRYEGEDQMWVHQQQVAAPLREMIPDGDEEEALFDGGESSPDDLALADLIRYDVDEFLATTLEEIESQVIQMRFGLDSADGIPKTQQEIAYELSLTSSKVRKLQKQALDKLREAYSNRYTSQDEDDHYWQDSV